jgi:hypothetical protein
MSAGRMYAEDRCAELCSPTFCGSSRNFDHHPLHQPRKAFDLLRVRAKLTGEARLDEGKFGNFQRSAWRRLVVQVRVHRYKNLQSRQKTYCRRPQPFFSEPALAAASKS